MKSVYNDRLNIAEIIPCTEAEGPGKRYAVWFQGCPIKCVGCCNPGMFSFEPEKIMTVDETLKGIEKTPGIEGVTFVGGEPFSQAVPAANLAERIRSVNLTLVVFSGYLYKELKVNKDPGVQELLLMTDILIDGPFINGQASGRRRWIGSDNQKIYFLSDAYKDLQDNWPRGQTAEIRFDGQSITINGDPFIGRKF